MKCPDCKDGFYYPLVGPPEPCQTCAALTIETSDLPQIITLKHGVFACNDQHLGKILKINVLSYHPLAVRFDGNCVTEYTDPESKEFIEIVVMNRPALGMVLNT